MFYEKLSCPVSISKRRKGQREKLPCFLARPSTVPIFKHQLYLLYCGNSAHMIVLIVNGTERDGCPCWTLFLSMGRKGISCRLAAKNFVEEGRKFCLGKGEPANSVEGKGTSFGRGLIP